MMRSFAVFCDKLESFVADVDSQWVVFRSCGFVNISIGIVDTSNVPQFVLVLKVYRRAWSLRCTEETLV